jgi:UDP-glucose 4-epimerase
MKVLVTGSSGHLGEALVRTYRSQGHDVVGIDLLESPFTTHVGTITDGQLVRRAMAGVDGVLHTATLHKPHVATHSMQDFIDTNVSGTLTLLEEAARANVGAFVFTSTTSTFGEALHPPPGEPAAWITEDVTPIPRNIYGVTKIAAEGLCQLVHKRHHMPCIILRTARFFPEEDDNRDVRTAYPDGNIKANEYLYRRADIADMVEAHVCALARAREIAFDRFIVSATTPFLPEDVADLRRDAGAVLARRVPGFAEAYRRHGWKMFPEIERVYVNEKARRVLGWRPGYNFDHVIDCLANDRDPRSPLAIQVGSKGYHNVEFEDGPYPVEPGLPAHDPM